jgi:hypothetical protein
MSNGKKDRNESRMLWLTIMGVLAGVVGVMVAIGAWRWPVSTGEAKEADVVHGPTSQRASGGGDVQQINGSGNLQQGGSHNVQTTGAVTVNNYATPAVRDITKDAKEQHEELWAPVTATSEKR